MISLSTCLTRLLLEDRLVKFITIILYKVYDQSSLWKSQLALLVLCQAVVYPYLLLAHLLILVSPADEFGHLESAFEHVEDLALGKDHEKSGEGLEEERISALENLKTQG